MKPNLRIEPGLLDNGERFDDPFFQQFTLRTAPAPLQLTEEIAKDYPFPTLYGDVTCGIAIFLCDYQPAAAMMPHPSMAPVRMPLGRAVVLFSCYEYRNVLGVGPYNEIAMTIPVMVGGGFRPPVLPLLMNLPNSGYYVFSMPVTSLENQIRGERIWGLPKVVEDIEIGMPEDQCTAVARDELGEAYFELKIPTVGKSKAFDETGYLYTVQEGGLLKSETRFKGDFVLTKDSRVLWRKGLVAGMPVLRLGDSPRADVLRQLNIEPVPLQTRFARSMNSCFDLPMNVV